MAGLSPSTRASGTAGGSGGGRGAVKEGDRIVEGSKSRAAYADYQALEIGVDPLRDADKTVAELVEDAKFALDMCNEGDYLLSQVEVQRIRKFIARWEGK